MDQSILISIQNWLLHASPGLIPLLALIYSGFSGVHCSLMCSPFVPKAEARQRFFMARIASYTLAGAAFGGFGKWLTSLLEVRALAAIAFLIFAATTLILLGFDFLPARFFARFRQPLSSSTSVLKGAFFAAMPCHSLAFFYAVAIATGSIWGGGLVLFGHAVVTTPALHWGAASFGRWMQKIGLSPRIARLAIVLLCTLNLAYFTSLMFYSSEESRQRLLFCF